VGKLEKILKKWQSRPTLVEKNEVISVLQRFGFELDFKRGSHIIVRHEKLIGMPNFGQNGEFTLPVKGGRKIKGFYLLQIIKAIEIIKEKEE